MAAEPLPVPAVPSVGVGIQPYTLGMDLRREILWQYEQAPIFSKIIEGMSTFRRDAINELFEYYVTRIFDIRSADRQGLLMWMKILGSRIPIGSARQDKASWGFGQYNANFAPDWNEGHGSNFGNVAFGAAALALNEFRLVVLMRFREIITRPTWLDIINLLQDVIGYNVAIKDLQNMTVEIRISVPMSKSLRAIIQRYNVIPRPAGVTYTYTFNASGTGADDEDADEDKEAELNG